MKGSILRNEELDKQINPQVRNCISLNEYFFYLPGVEC